MRVSVTTDVTVSIDATSYMMVVNGVAAVSITVAVEVPVVTAEQAAEMLSGAHDWTALSVASGRLVRR